MTRPLVFRRSFHNTSGYNNTATVLTRSIATQPGATTRRPVIDALNRNTTGSHNTATGAGALSSNTASYNTATGYQALVVNTTGSYNTATGYAALLVNHAVLQHGQR